MSDIPANSPDAYAEYAQKPTAAEGLAVLADLAEQQLQASLKVIEADAAAKKALDELKELCEKKIPAFMDELGIEEFKLSNGMIIKVEETIRAAIPKGRADEAYKWLRDHGQAALIKRAIVLVFGMGEDELAEEWVKFAREKGLEDIEDKTAVHPSTLSSYVKGQLEVGGEMPDDLDMLGVFRQRASKIELPKVKKPKAAAKAK